MLLIVNPRSGKSKGKEILKETERILKSKGVKFNSQLTESGDHIEELALRGVREDFEKVAVIGGDGTIGRAAQSLIGTDVSMGIIPAGTGNDFSESLNIPQKTSKALDLICKGNSTRIDVGKVSFANDSRYFVNVFGIGFDAQVAKDTQLAERQRGLTGFALSALRELPSFKGKTPSILNWGHTPRALMVLVANGKRAGKYFQVAPDADLTDGKLNLVFVEDLSFMKRIECLTRACFGRHESMSEVRSEEIEEVEIDVPDSWIAQFDGEPTELEGTIKIEVIPRCLKVISNY